ncbi:MAG: cation:proton antiporter [Bacillota bacterium]|nr:cation:proton antiporter [Bacillota bacterium]
MEATWFSAATWMWLALGAGVLARLSGVSVPLVEIGAGVLAGNLLSLDPPQWLEFLAGFGSIMLTFLAGAEVDPAVLRSKAKESVSIGMASFLAPFLGAMFCARYVTGWDAQAAQIAGIALSTTSVAVVYAVMVETGLNRTEIGKNILAACFVTDLGTVVALGAFFARSDWKLLTFATVTAASLAVVGRLSPRLFCHFRNHVAELEGKMVAATLFTLGGLALAAGSEAVLPAYLLGLAMAGTLGEHPHLLHKLRATAFLLLTPFYFMKAGLFVSLPALAAGLGTVILFLAVKIGCKFMAVQPLTSLFRFRRREGTYATLLMSTGLTFGTISSLFGLQHGIIDRPQYTVLVTVVVLSAVVPTLIAQAFFRPQSPQVASAPGATWNIAREPATPRGAEIHSGCRGNKQSGECPARRSGEADPYA